jgi:hypothetical protein
MSYFRGKFDDGYRDVFFDDIGAAIAALHPDLVGAHIFRQLDALGLYQSFIDGETPYGLPYSFSKEKKDGG